MEIRQLRGFVPFNSLSGEALAQAAELAQVTSVAAGETLFQRGDSDLHRYYLLQGRMALDAGDSMPPLLIQAGSEAGRHPLARQKPRRYTAIAQSPCHIAAFDEVELDELVAQDQANAYGEDEANSVDPYWMFDLLRNPAFALVPPANLQALFKQFRPKSVKAGEVIVKQGDAKCEFYYLIREGQAQVARKNDIGVEVVLARLGPGHSFGEEALIAHAARNATVTMLSDGLIMLLSSEDFDTLLKQPLVRLIPPEEAVALLRAGSADLIDVRLPDEFRQDGIRGSVNLPLCTLRLRAGALDQRRTHIMVCETERRSSIAAFILSQRGLDTRVLQGGLNVLKSRTAKAPAGQSTKTPA